VAPTQSARLLMTLSAVTLAALGVVSCFLPQEILQRAGATPDRFPVAVVQIAGALYFGFAMLNWSAKGMLLGGIYGRPIVVANLTHFVIGAIGLLEVRDKSGEVVAAAGAYSLFAAWFGYVLFGPGPPSGKR
jgi:hypothetical protein